MNHRNHTESSPKKSAPHHRITFKEVIEDYQAGMLTPAGAIFYLIAASRKMGQPIRISISRICEQLCLSKATWYRAIATLEEQGRLKLSAPDEVEVIVPTSTTEGVPDYIFLNELSQICDKNSQICDNFSQICDKNSQICDKNSQICNNESPEPAPSVPAEIPQLELLDQLDQLTTEGSSPTCHPVFSLLEESGIELTEDQFKQLQFFHQEQIEQAIAVVRGSKRVIDRVRLFFKALRNGWRSNLPRESESNFREWFDRAYAAGRVIASMGTPDGIVIILPDGRQLPFLEAVLEVGA